MSDETLDILCLEDQLLYIEEFGMEHLNYLGLIIQLGF